MCPSYCTCPVWQPWWRLYEKKVLTALMVPTEHWNVALFKVQCVPKVKQWLLIQQLEVEAWQTPRWHWSCWPHHLLWSDQKLSVESATHCCKEPDNKFHSLSELYRLPQLFSPALPDQKLAQLWLKERDCVPIKPRLRKQERVASACGS